MGKTVGGIFKVIAGAAIGMIPGFQAVGGAIALSGIADIVTGTIGSFSNESAASLSRLTLTFDGEAPRKIWLGETAANTDGIYQEAGGTDQEYVDMIIAVAAHEVDAISTIMSEDKVMWTVGGGAQGDYVGYLTVTPVLKGVSGAGLAINGGAKWNANCSLTGCAYVRLRMKRTGNDKKASSPFATGIPARLTIIGRGAKVYDPRRDSTMGGAGTHRMTDETTWRYSDGGVVLGTNPALQALTFLIGWRIGGVVSVGAGIPVNRLAMADWIAAANVCDEPVGFLRRYETHGVFGDDDAPDAVLASLCAHMNAVIRDTGGKIGVRMAINDLGGALVTFDEDDVMGDHDWQPFTPLNESFNVVRGSWSDPSTAALYQKAPYPARAIAAPDGINRTLSLDLPMIQDPTIAQRVAQQALRRAQFGGTFTVTVGPRAWAAEVGQPVRWNFAPLGFESKIFRVVRQRIVIVNSQDDAQSFCEMTFREEDASIYGFVEGDASAVPAAIPAVSYLPSNQPFLITQGIDIGVANGADVTAVALASDAIVLGVAAPITVGALITAAKTGSSTPVPPKAITGLGASAALDIVMVPGGAILFRAIVYFDLTSGTRTLSCPLEHRIGTGAWVGFGTAINGSDVGPATLDASASGSLTNATAQALNYQVRAVVAVTGSTGGTVDAARSYVGLG